MITRLRVAQLHGHELRTSAVVIAQVWMILAAWHRAAARS
jgi:hypothetical protein